MSKYNNVDNRFKYYVIGTLVIMVLLILGIFLIPNKFPDSLKENNINNLADEIYGNRNDDEYLVYLYYPTCGACQSFMATNTYKNYIDNPSIPMYKINTNDAPKDFLREIDLKYTPTVMYIKKINGSYKVIDAAENATDAENLLKKLS